MELKKDEVLNIYAHLRLLQPVNLNCLHIMSKLEHELSDILSVEEIQTIENWFFQKEEK